MMVNCYGYHNKRRRDIYLPSHPVLLDVHLALSVMEPMRGAAEYDEIFNG